MAILPPLTVEELKKFLGKRVAIIHDDGETDIGHCCAVGKYDELPREDGAEFFLLLHQQGEVPIRPGCLIKPEEFPAS
jgi:hypothetical protein